MDYPQGLCYGRLDVPLAVGWRHWATVIAADLSAQPARIWSSPATRCAVPGAWFADLLGVEMVLDARLMELDFGLWEGRRWEQVERCQLDRWQADPVAFAPPGGEAGASLIQRVAGFAASLAANAQTSIVLSHGGPLRLLSALLRGEPPKLLAPAPAIGSATWVISGI